VNLNVSNNTFTDSQSNSFVHYYITGGDYKLLVNFCRFRTNYKHVVQICFETTVFLYRCFQIVEEQIIVV
jgi:hypothetical protein